MNEIEMENYVDWHESVEWGTAPTHGRYDEEDFAHVAAGNPLSYWDGIAVDLVPCTHLPTETRALLAPTVVCVLVCDGYVYPLSSWEELDSLQKEHQE